MSDEEHHVWLVDPLATPHWEAVDCPVINGVATLPDGSTVQSTAQVVRVVVGKNGPREVREFEWEHRVTGADQVRGWPVSVSLERCPICHRLLWPWQDVVFVFDPDGSSKQHHGCYHAHIRDVWEGPGIGSLGDAWPQELECDHRP